MKKLLALDQGEYLGGAELFFSDLLTRVDQEFEVHLITGNNADYQNRYKRSLVTIHPLSLPPLRPIGPRKYKRYKQLQEKIEEIIDRVQPDLIVSNTVRTHLLSSKLAKKKNISLIWMAHDVTFPSFLMRRFKKCPQKIISCSQFVERYYKAIIGEHSNLNYEVLYPFAIDEGRVQEVKQPKKEKVIGMVGKFIPWKGQDLFLKVAKKIHEQYPEYRFEIIGTPYKHNRKSEHFFESCQDLIRQLELDEVVFMKGYVPDIFTELNRWDILVHCSREPEPLGRVVLEGMVAHCSVVASALGGPKEIIRNQETGLVVEPTVDDIFEAVKWYLEHSKEKEMITKLAQKQALEKYLWPNAVGRFKKMLSL